MAPLHYDRRVPPAAALPLLLAPLTVAWNVEIARLTLLLSFGALLPIACASRIVDAWPARPLGAAIELARPVAAVLYAAALTSLIPLAHDPLQTALTASAGAALTAGAIAYVAPGTSTPAGLRLLKRREAGLAQSREVVEFFARRLAVVLSGAAILAAAIAPLLLTAIVALAAAGAHLTVATLRVVPAPRRPAPAHEHARRDRQAV